MTPAEARRRMEVLRAEIAHHDALYYQKAAPEISDYAYDQLKRELSDLENAFPAVRGDRLLPVIGDDRTGLFPVCRHRQRMLSLDKTYSEAELRAFHARLARQLGRDDLYYVVEPKIDGLAVSVTYEHGELLRAVTRGNGEAGDDITANVLTIHSLPRRLAAVAPDGSPNPIPDLIELRGEIYLPFAEYERINREREAAGEPLFANPRNLAAGTVKLFDSQRVAERKLEIVFYGWGACEPATMGPVTQHGFHEQVRAWGLPALSHWHLVSGVDGLWAAAQAFAGERRQLDFPVDGVVAKLDAVPWQRVLGETDHAPRWALAYKYVPAQAETRLRAIVVQVGRTGLLTPVAELEPVRVGGSTVSRVTLHNAEVIARQDIRVGDFVLIEKAGEVIPEIVGVDLARRSGDSQPYAFPTTCPACGTAVGRREGETAAYCPNAACQAQVQRRVEHFVSSACVDIRGLGPAAIAALVEHGRLRSVADLYRLNREDLLTLERKSGRSADQLRAAISRSKGTELWRFIYGLSMPHVGPSAAKMLARKFGRLEALAGARRADFATQPSDAREKVSAATADAVLTFFNRPENRALVAELLSLGVHPVLPESAPMHAGK